MRIAVILAAALLFTVGGFFVGGSMVDSSSVSTSTPLSGVRDPQRELAESMKNFSAGAEVMRQRQERGMIGAGIGLVIGVAGGALLASQVGKKK